MPRLPTAADLGARPISAPVGVAPVAVNTASAEALQRAGGQLAGLGDELAQRQAIERDRADTLRAEEGYSELIERSLEFTEGEDGFRRKRGAEVANKPITEDYWGRYEQAARDIEGRLGNGVQRAKFQARAKAFGHQYRKDLLQHISRERETYGRQVYDNATNVEVRSAGLHWDDQFAVAASVERMNAVINGRAEDEDWDDDTLNLERANRLSGLHASVVVSALDNDGLKYAEDYFKRISPEVDDDTRHKLSRAIDGKRKEQQAEARQQQVLFRLDLQETVGDVQAAYLSGIKYEGGIPQQQDFTAGYGPEEGKKRYESFQKILAVGEDIQTAALASPQEQAALLAKNQPAPTAGFKDAQERQQILAASIARINKEREDDPARFSIQRIPAVGSAYQAMVSAAPEEATAFAEEYVNQVQAASADLGIQNPKVLPDQFAAQIVAGFYDQKEGGEPAAARILGERQRWGRAWPAVWSQISKDLPGAAFVIGAGMSVEAGRRLAEVSTVDREQLNKWLPQGTNSGHVNDEVTKALSDAGLSLAGQPGADKLYSTLVDSAERLATRYIGSGKDVKDAAEQAANEVFNERYSFFDHNDSTIRVPRPYDGSDVKSAMKVVTRDLAGVPGVDEAQWVTLPNDAGVALTWMGGLMKRPDGSQIVYGWDDLLNRAATVGYSQGLPPDPARRIR